jgi:hypothetical protein
MAMTLPNNRIKKAVSFRMRRCAETDWLVIQVLQATILGCFDFIIQLSSLEGFEKGT